MRAREFLDRARSRARRRLAGALAYPVALVAAPEGFGKTTVVRDALRASDRRCWWVRIDPPGIDLLGIVRALAATMADVAPALSSSFVTVYDRLADAPDAGDRLAAWAAGHLGAIGEALVVVDGFAGAYDPRAATFIVSLIDRTRQTVRWVVIAESSEHFPVARWFAEDRIDIPVDATDLALSAADLLAAGGPDWWGEPGSEPLGNLRAASAGWPAVVALALAYPAPLDGAPALPAGSADLYAYVARGALAALSERSRDFVEATCLFDNFDAALLACAGLTRVEAILAELCAGMGIMSADGRGNFAYDRLFRAHVVDALEARADGALRNVAERTARAYERAGRFGAAIDILIMLGDEIALCRLLTAHGFVLIDRGEAGVLARALRTIPHDVLLDFPAALGVKASLESLHGKSDIAEAWFRIALARIVDESQRHEIVFRFARDLVRRDRPEALDVLAPVVSALPAPTPMTASLLGLYAVAQAYCGQPAAASATIDRALLLLPLVDRPATRAQIVCQAGYVALHLRDIPAAKDYARRAYAEALDGYGYDVAARAQSILYCVAIDFEDDIAASRRHVERLADASGRAGSRELLLYATLCSYEIEAYAGNADEIERLDGELASLDVVYSVLTTETLLPSQALQASWSGNFERAFRLLESSAAHQISPDRRAHRHAEIAVYAAAAGLADQAGAAAEAALALIREIQSDEKTVLIAQAYVALAFAVLRRHGRAGKLLRELTARAPRTGRSAALVDAIALLAERFAARAKPGDVGAALERLEAADLGGIARMIEALPLPRAARGSAAAAAADAGHRRNARTRRRTGAPLDYPRSFDDLAPAVGD